MKPITLALALAVSSLVGTAFADDLTTVKGEVIDVVCYVDHGATGEKHEKCATKCISSGLPVGIKSEDGKVYILAGDHKPVNNELAAMAGKTISVKGKLSERDGVSLLHNIEIVK